MSVVQCHKAIFFLMRIIAVWSLFARWKHSVTEEEGCSPHGLKNTTWPSRSVEIFSIERQRISRSGTFIATSEHTLNSAYNQHESRVRCSPLGWHLTADIRKWKILNKNRMPPPDRASMWLPVYMKRAEWSQEITFLLPCGVTKRRVAWRLKSTHRNGHKEHGLTMRVRWGDIPVASSHGVEEVGVQPVPIVGVRSEGVSELRLNVTLWRQNRRKHEPPRLSEFTNLTS